MRTFVMPQRGIGARLRTMLADTFGRQAPVRIGHIKAQASDDSPAPLARPTRSRFRSHYAGAAGGRLLGDFQATMSHPDNEIRWALRELVARSRDLWRNNSYVEGFAQALRDNVLGADGVQIQAQIRTDNGKLATATCRRIEQGWREWGGDPEAASLDGCATWGELEWLILETVARDGECFIRERRGADNRYGFTVELIPCDLLDPTYDVPPDADGVEIRMGVEMDRQGRRRAYHFWSRHPDDRFGGGRGQRRVPVPASEIIHLYVRRWPGQTRGVPWLAPVISDTWMFSGLTEAELTAARIESAKMGFFVNKTEDAIAAYAARQAAAQAAGEEPEGPLRMDVAPGVMEELPPGLEFQQFNPTHPNGNLGNFSKLILRGVARGMGVSYGTLTGDLSEANYSSMRAGLLPERDRWRSIQKWLTTRLHGRVYRTWVQMASLKRAVRVDARLASDFFAVVWKPRGWRPVDPLKDRQADLLAWQMRVKSLADIAADEGRDLEEVFEQIAYEMELAAEKGIILPGPMDAAETAAALRPTESDSQPATSTDTEAAERKPLAA